MTKNSITNLTELKRNPAGVLEKVKIDPVYLIRRSEVAAVMVDPDLFENMIEALEDDEDTFDVLESQSLTASKRGKSYSEFQKTIDL